MADLVIVKQAGTIVIDGVVDNVREGELFEADHPAVKQFPHLFGPITLRYPVERESKPVEQATRAPGEKRKR